MASMKGDHSMCPVSSCRVAYLYTGSERNWKGMPCEGRFPTKLFALDLRSSPIVRVVSYHTLSNEVRLFSTPYK